MSILNLIRPELLQSTTYIPQGEGSNSRLHANELPWSPVDFNSIALNYYPNKEDQQHVADCLAARYGVDANQIALTRGSDEGIDLACRLFLNSPQDGLMQFSPTFAMYAFYVRLQQALLIDCPLDEADGFSLNEQKITNYWKPNCKIIMFCRPNNPTGTMLSLEFIASVCQRYASQSVIIVDEAYIEFTEAESATTLIPRFENLVVTRTLSKACGMAGLRLGCLMAQAPIIDAFKKIIPPYTISSTVLDLVKQALERSDWFLTAVERIKSERSVLMQKLQGFTFIEKIYPSEANFILLKTAKAQELTAFLAKERIAVRDFPTNPLLYQHLRITVGDKEQNKLILAALSSYSLYAAGVNDAKNTIY